MGPWTQDLDLDPELPALQVSRRRTVSWMFVFQICDIAINWAGGLHHAKKFEVSEEVMGEIMVTSGSVFRVTVGAAGWRY